MAKKQIKFGIVGCGVIGRFHAKAMAEAPAAKLVAVADIRPERARALAEKHACKWYGSLEEMLKNPEVEAVSVCTPSGLHAEHGMQSAKAGRHIIIEKPLDRDLAKVDRLAAYCKRKGLKMGGIFQYRTFEGARKVKQAIEEGRLGRLICGSAEIMWYRAQEYYDADEWRGTLALDGGCLWNQGIHFIDLLCWMLGEPKKVLFAKLDTLERKMEAEDFGVAAVEFKNGAIGMIRGTTLANPGLPARLEICGTKGVAVIHETNLVHFSIAGEKHEPAADKGGSFYHKDVGYPSHIGLIQDFAEAILYDREPFISGMEGRRAVKLLTEIYKIAGIENRAKVKGKRAKPK